MCRMPTNRWIGLTLIVAASCLYGCGDPPRIPIVIELAEYTDDDVIASPTGEGEIIAKHVLVDFDDTLPLAEIDDILASRMLKRVGLIGGVNQITAKISDGRTEVAVLSELEGVPGVEGASLIVLLQLFTTTTERLPIYSPPSTNPKDTLSEKELHWNWPHLVMDTFQAHALADAILGGDELKEVTLAVVDTGFQKQAGTTPADVDGSILADPNDTDLVPKTVSPTGASFAATLGTGVHTIVSGPKASSSNALIASARDDHGLIVAASAVGSGQNILGTGRHVHLRPVRFTLDPVGVKSGSPINSFDHLLAMFAFLADEDSSDLKVVNCSIGAYISDPARRRAVADLFRPHFRKLIEGGRIIVIAAGNDGISTEQGILTSMGHVRGTPRTSDPIDAGLLIVGGTALPDFTPDSDIIAILLRFLNDLLGTYDFEDKMERVYDFTFGSGRDGSNPGPHVAVSAPAEAVPRFRTDLKTITTTFGTSISAPYVAGLAAEMFAVDSTATNRDIVDIIEETADDIGDPNPDDQVGMGRINCWKAILTLLNRNRRDDPEWLGIRFRNALIISPDEEVFLNGNQIDDVVWRRVPDVPRELDSNFREVPSATALPAALSASFSFTTDELKSQPGGIALLEVRTPSGSIVYQIPLRLGDLLSLERRPLDTLLDDFVITFDVHTEFAAIYGRVVDENGQPVGDAKVAYDSLFGGRGESMTESDGYYIIYDALPDAQIELNASAPGFLGDSADSMVAALRSLRHDFQLSKTTQTANCDLGTGRSMLKFFAELEADGIAVGGTMDEVTVDGRRLTALREFRFDLTLDAATCELTGKSTTLVVTVYAEGILQPLCEFTTTTSRQWTGQATTSPFGGLDVTGTVSHLSTNVQFSEVLMNGREPTLTDAECAAATDTTFFQGNLEWSVFLREEPPFFISLGRYGIDLDQTGQEFSRIQFSLVDP